jgi:hypothetical protein
MSHMKTPKTITVNGTKTNNILLKSTDPQNLEKCTAVGGEVTGGAVVF